MPSHVHAYQGWEVISVEACVSLILIFNCVSYSFYPLIGCDGLGRLSTVQRFTVLSREKNPN